MDEPKWVARLRKWARGLPPKFERLPGWSQRSVFAAGLFALVTFAFLGIVAPLFATSQAVGEVDGQYPSAINLGHSAGMQLAFDNTGDGAVQPVCISVTTNPSVTLNSVNFQGVDNVKFTSTGRVCGGSLATQEDISLTIYVTPHDLGPVEFSITPLQGTHAIGTPLTGQVLVVKSGGI